MVENLKNYLLRELEQHSARYGWPVAVIEYQGKGHGLDGIAGRRDEIKRIVPQAAGVRFVEIEAGTSATEIRRTVQSVFDEHMAARSGGRTPR